MCGIVGFVGAPGDSREQAAWLAQATAALAHRGPDGQGTRVDPPAALGHRRLSVIDLDRGAQPMEDASKRALIVLNGEIYNFRELRERLERSGERFRTRSDTEVLLRLYLREGAACLDRIEGMFAFAIWDRDTRTLFAARDRMGKKPFYYTLQNGVFAFASELTALRRLPFLSLEPSAASVARFLSYEYVPTPDTIYRDVRKLEPAHRLTLTDGNLAVEPYWELPSPPDGPGPSMREAAEQLRHLLARAVQRRLVADVPLGVLLSGGVDSSAVVALMDRCSPRPPLRTFTIGFSEPSYDESAFARAVAESHGADHTVEVLSAEDAGESLPAIVERLDEPLADPSIVPTQRVCAAARRSVTVVLGGDGGDELFGGYEYFVGFLASRLFDATPAFVPERLLRPLCRLLPYSDGYVSPRFAAERFLEGAAGPRWLRTQTWLQAFSPEQQRAIWAADPGLPLTAEAIYEPTLARYNGCSAASPVDRVFHVFARQYLLDYILPKVDRCSMMHGLEVRAPFLDRELVEFAFGLPRHLKVRGFERKRVLRRALAGLVPPSILDRPKRGFLLPSSLWLNRSLRPLVDEYLGAERLRRQGWFRPESVARLVAEHRSGRADHRKALWTLLVLQLWLDRHA